MPQCASAASREININLLQFLLQRLLLNVMENTLLQFQDFNKTKNPQCRQYCSHGLHPGAMESISRKRKCTYTNRKSGQRRLESAGFLSTFPRHCCYAVYAYYFPTNFHEVTQRTEFVEILVVNGSKMQSMFALRDKIYADIFEPFHWDL